MFHKQKYHIKMNHVAFSLTCCAAMKIFGYAGISCSLSDEPQGKDLLPPPNIVFIMADDLGCSDINCFDPLRRTFYETPNIDKLAKHTTVHLK
jgi:hypothetical protein